VKKITPEFFNRSLGVINLLVRTHQEPSAAPIDIPAHLQLKEPPLADCARYDHFRKDSADATR